jgi:hypothetical protein
VERWRKLCYSKNRGMSRLREYVKAVGAIGVAVGVFVGCIGTTVKFYKKKRSDELATASSNLKPTQLYDDVSYMGLFYIYRLF